LPKNYQNQSVLVKTTACQSLRVIIETQPSTYNILALTKRWLQCHGS